MRTALQQRPLRLVFIANMVSMLGSGMNMAGVFWYALQVTHSEMTLSTLLILQTIPALLLLPISGVIIDREDRRHLLMWLDAIRAVVILAVGLVALLEPAKLQLWHLYAMFLLVSGAFWMFWPTVNALLQELTPAGDFLQANTLLMAGVQGGFFSAARSWGLSTTTSGWAASSSLIS